LVIVDLEPDADPPRILAIGPDVAGNLLEIIWLEFADRPSIVVRPCHCAAPSTTCFPAERTTDDEAEDLHDASGPGADR
jgi:hypothetical protein